MANYTVYENNLRGEYKKVGVYNNWYAVVDDYLKHSVILGDAYKTVIIDEGYKLHPTDKLFNMSEAEYFFDKFCEIVLRKLTETGKFEMSDFYIEQEDKYYNITLRADHVEVIGPDKLKIIYPCEVNLARERCIQEPVYALGHEDPDNLTKFSFYGKVCLTETQLKEYAANNFTNSDMFMDIFNKSGYAFNIE